MSKNGKLLKYEVINTKKDKKLMMAEENQVALIKSLYLNFLIKLII